MNDLIPFNFDGHDIRVVMIDGEPWFVAKDLCDVLEIGNPSEAMKRLDDDEKMTLSNTEGQKINTESHSGKRGGAQFFNVVNESGVYNLIFASRKPEARRFRRWVTSELLPTLRKTGHYAMLGAEPSGPRVPAHEADKLVAADRVFRAMLRAGRAAGLPTPTALKRANLEVVRQTGIDILEKTGCVTGDDVQGPDWSEHSSAFQFVRALTQGEFSSLHEYPMRSQDLFEFYRDWCKSSQRWPESQRALNAAMVGYGLARRVRAKMMDLETGEYGNQQRVFVLPGIDVPHSGISKWYSYWSEQALSVMDSLRHQWVNA
ncbi:BRO domain protein [Nitrosococcus halophilus Nc 4]|uniref:BRO domain protein n=1 Tax=Nitrosococcus halophilus (strain Nc4) TaxID=472759 RepID=D5BYU3_NITHN|nr:Bro-N domain-containing protein [Nitrosococcus halophilus]ADE14156.1 BRO domain protein [Nitrosococcus halophilus Nc 4]